MFHESVYEKRIRKLQNQLNPHTLYLYSTPSQITYFTGFQFLVPNEREAFFLCGNSVAALIHTSFAPLNNFEFLSYWSGTFPNQLQDHIQNISNKESYTILQFDPKTLFVSEFTAINEVQGITTQPMERNDAAVLMQTKGIEEISLIKKACELTSHVMKTAISNLKIGITEQEVEQEIKSEFRKVGIEELAFPTLVAFGDNGTKPHHLPTNKQLTENCAVTLDMGAQFEGYCADMTRSFWFGNNPTDEYKKIEKIVLEAHSLTIQTLQKHTQRQITAKDVDNSARNHISNQGFGDNFIHTTGHGLGLEIHEQPSLIWRNLQRILPNMTITVEPGVYIEGNIGYRHEDTILITETGIENLTQTN